MIDTHAHVVNSVKTGEDKFRVFTDEVETKELSLVVLAGTGLADSQANIELAKTNSLYKACVGIHPEEASKYNEIELGELSNKLDKLISDNKDVVVAIGECGLDGTVPLQNQEKVFGIQIELAKKHNLPLVIHARKRNDEIIEILKTEKVTKGVFHCYTGGGKRIKQILELGDWYFGIDGNITYDPGLQEVLKNIPRDRLVLETDCPFLTPVPHRGEKNYPQYVKYVYEKVAELWGEKLEIVEQIIDANAKKLFTL